MISISMVTANTTGQLILNKEVSSLKDRLLRVSRSATLDGGCIIVNSGASESDRTFTVASVLSKEQEEALSDMVNNAVQVLFSCTEGLFLGVISKVVESTNGRTKITFLVKSKEN